MNIQVQCCGMVLMSFLLYFYFRQKTVGLYTEKIFLKTLYITMICVGLDIISVIAIYHHEEIPHISTILCKSYVVSVVWVGYSALTYILTDLYDRQEYYKAIRKYTITVCMASLIVYCLPIYFYQNGQKIYTYGASVTMTYVFALLFVISSIIVMIRCRYRLNPRRRNAAIMWMIAWLVAALIQFIRNDLLIVGFACALGMTILFFALENPEANMDRQLGCFNSHALMEYLKQLFVEKKNFSVLLISYAQYQESGDDRHQINRCLLELVKMLKLIPHVKIFKNVERELVVFCDTQEQLDVVLEQLQSQILPQMEQQFRWIEWTTNTLHTPLLLQLRDGRIAQDAQEVIRLLHFYKQHQNITPGNVIEINEMTVQESHERMHIQETLLQALKEDRVEVFYQPIYSVQQKRFVSAEALMRIRNQDGSILPPAKFIKVAEETGLIVPLGERVFEKTCMLLNKSRIEIWGLEYIEVNLSVIQCEQENLAQTYQDIMKRCQIHPKRINLEITETASIQAKKSLLENMRVLIAQGVTFSLDDFGNGKCNLDYLIDMPVALMKLDMNMTRAYFEKEKARHAVEATVNMVHDMHLKVVAEGIETKEQLDTMSKIGIDYIQGYYFSKPLPEPEFLEFIRSRNTMHE